MTPKFYTLFTDTLETGIGRGITYAYKHTDSPSTEVLSQAIYNHTLVAFHDYFHFTDEDCID